MLGLPYLGTAAPIVNPIGFTITFFYYPVQGLFSDTQAGLLGTSHFPRCQRTACASLPQCTYRILLSSFDGNAVTGPPIQSAHLFD